MGANDFYKGEKRKLSESEKQKRIERMRQEATKPTFGTPTIIGKKTKEDIRGGS